MRKGQSFHMLSTNSQHIIYTAFINTMIVRPKGVAKLIKVRGLRKIVS